MLRYTGCPVDSYRYNTYQKGGDRCQGNNCPEDGCPGVVVLFSEELVFSTQPQEGWISHGRASLSTCLPILHFLVALPPRELLDITRSLVESPPT